jgi:diguanylate cyclase (GGDEF)-like protein
VPSQDRADVLSASVIGDLVELDRATVSELLSRYATGSSANLKRTRQALIASDAPAVASAADRLRSSSLIIGAARVATIAEQLQTTARAGDLAPAHNLTRDLAGALKQARAALRRALADLNHAGPDRRAPRPRRRNGAETTEALVRAYGDTLRVGDPHAAAVVIDDAQSQGLSSVEIQSWVIAPAMWGIGELWERGALTVAEEHLATAVSHHVLTRLYPGLLSKVQRRGDTIAVAAVHGEHLIDVDHFKAVNDGFGHDAGDRVLIEVAACITRAMRPDDFAARYGGDEFAALLPDTPAHVAAQIGERIRSAITSELTDPPVTVSIGVSVPDHADRRRATLDVDRALYEAKQHGRNQVSFA